MEFNVEATLFSEKNMLFTLKDGEHHADCRIGHVRGDFGSNGNEFHHTWWPQHEELNTDEFKTELTQVDFSKAVSRCNLSAVTTPVRSCWDIGIPKPMASRFVLRSICIISRHFTAPETITFISTALYVIGNLKSAVMSWMYSMEYSVQ
mgnify:CR=1 FL=1